MAEGMDPDKLLVNARKCMKTVISDPTDANAGLELAEAFRTLDDAITCVGMLPTDWEIGKRLTWEPNGRRGGDNFILKFNGITVGHAYAREVEGGTKFVYQADLAPTKDLPYRVISKLDLDAGETIDEAMLACGRYVWEQIANVFDPWKALREECLI